LLQVQLLLKVQQQMLWQLVLLQVEVLLQVLLQVQAAGTSDCAHLTQPSDIHRIRPRPSAAALPHPHPHIPVGRYAAAVSSPLTVHRTAHTHTPTRIPGSDSDLG
jgi:hypothetical protein